MEIRRQAVWPPGRLAAACIAGVRGMVINMNNKRILITGGAKGIGAETARMFARNGAEIIYLVDIDEENGIKTAGELSEYCKCVFRRMDVTDEIGVAELFREIAAGGGNHPGASDASNDDRRSSMEGYGDRNPPGAAVTFNDNRRPSIEGNGGGLDVLFNCAGITSVKGLFDTDMALWNRIMAINVTSVFLFSKEALRLMCAQNYGRIINVSSVSAHVGGIRTSPAYAASKAAILGLTRSFAKYGAKYNVTVNAVAPGIVDTDMTRDPAFVYSNDEVPLGGAASPADIARTVLFLAGEGGGHITGQCINVNGGMYYN